ncbi:MAG: rod shape-determining protein MreC [Burkholderiales bacterium]
MALGTLDRTPPPFFRQGPSALTKLTLCSALALFLMVADTRFQLTQPLRALIATALHPVQRLLLVPVQVWQGGGDYVRGLQEAQAAQADAQRILAEQAERVAQVEPLQTENARLRALLALQPRLQVRQQAAEVLYAAADPYSRKLVVNRGRQQGVVEGSPAITEQGVVGQVTRVYPLTSEVTLLTDKDAAIPLLNARTGQRGAAFGVAGGMGSAGGLELRFMASSSDVQVGDVMTTSGVDGVYPPGLAVARVALVQRQSQDNFARVLLTPTAVNDGLRHVLLLEPLSKQMPPTVTETAEAPAAASTAKKGARR